MQLSVTVTSLGGALVIQDPHPVRGLFSKTVPAGSALTFTCPWDIWHRINAQVEAYRVAGLCTVALSEVTPTGTDSTSGLNTTYNKADWAHLNSFRKDIDALQTTVGTVTAPTLNKGEIAANTDFPLLADVEDGWSYTVTADVTDNAGVTYTNTGLVFTVNEEIVWNGTTWIRLGKELTGAFQTKGNIAIAADFPPPVATATTGVRDGFVYRVTAPVTDNDATKTNTGQVFELGDIIVWRTTAWYTIHSLADETLIAAHEIAIAAINDDHVHMVAANVDMKTDESEISAALNGDPTKMFLATHIFIKSVVNVGALNADGTLNVGTSADGAQLLSAQALTGIGAVDTCRMIPLAEHGVTVAGNATLYVNVEAADTGAGTLNIDVVVLGRQL